MDTLGGHSPVGSSKTADIRIAPDKFTTSVAVPRMKRRVKRPTVAEGSKYIDACRGEECYLRVPGVCCSIGWAHESVVDCHSNQLRHGKGKGIKAQNIYTVPGCGPCHEYIDRGPAPRAEKFALWDAAYEQWKPVRARKMGIIELEAA